MLVELLHSIELNMRESLGVFLNNINVITGGVAILASGWITIWAIYRSYLILAGLEAGSFVPIFKDLFIKIIIIVGVATAPAYYKEIVPDLLIGTTTQLGQELSGTEDPNIFTKAGEVLDRAVEGLTVTGNAPPKQEEQEDPDAAWYVKGWSWLKKKISGVWDVISYPFSAIAEFFSTITKLFIISAAALWLCVATFFTVFTSQIFAYISLAIGPLFLFFSAFEITRNWFFSWLSITIGYLFTFIVVMVVWGFLLNLFSEMFYKDATEPLTWAATFKSAIACIFFAMIMGKISDLASSWFGAGNFTSGTNSMFLGNAKSFAQLLTKGKGRRPKGEKGGGKGKASISENKS